MRVEKKRIFIGVGFDEATANRLEEIQNAWKEHFAKQDLRWIPKRNIHLTLHFLGLIEDWRVGMIENSLSKISYSPFSFSLNRILGFPSSHKARVVCLGGQEGTSPLSNLYFKIGNEIEQIGFKMETRVFVPHVTLARANDPISLPSGITCDPLEIKVTGFTLYESRTLPSGSEYDSLRVFPLH